MSPINYPLLQKYWNNADKVLEVHASSKLTACLQTNYSKYDPFSNTTVTIIAVRRVVRSSLVADEGPQAGGLLAKQWRDQISVDPPRCPPAAKYFYILERRRPSGSEWQHEDETAREKTSRPRVITGELEWTQRKRTRRPRPAGRYTTLIFFEHIK
ncbi:hypothetical protein T08_7123 [Trichinella sp. T8]|nr:hypothetical protein T08_7123 [Trichinella sp. T8]